MQSSAELNRVDDFIGRWSSLVTFWLDAGFGRRDLLFSSDDVLLELAAVVGLMKNLDEGAPYLDFEMWAFGEQSLGVGD